jgi:2OG-Fe(II) oxygenase superfamily
MKIQSLHDEVWEIQDFITEKEAATLMNFVSSDARWISTSAGGETTSAELTETIKDLLINQTIMPRLSSVISNWEKVTSIVSVNRLVQGEELRRHEDNFNGTGSVVFGCIVYLNDDYLGGEIYYEFLNLTIKPKARSMIFHKSHLLHQVLPVIIGERYTLTTFISGDENKIKIANGD